MYSWDDMSGAVEEIDIKHDSALDTPKFCRDKRARPLATCPILPCAAATMSAKDFYLAKKNDTFRSKRSKYSFGHISVREFTSSSSSSGLCVSPCPQTKRKSLAVRIAKYDR